jgi:putative alpha-1,2-mannosidase
MLLLVSPSKVTGSRLVRRRSMVFGQVIHQSVIRRLFHQSQVKALIILSRTLHNDLTYYHRLTIGSEVGALLTFSPAPGGGKTTILARVGVSFISSAQACSNANSEIPDFNFEGVRSASRAQWNDLLGRIQVNTAGVPTQTVQLFYSSVGIPPFQSK